MDLSEEDVQKILKVLDQLDYGEIRLEVGDLKLHVQKSPLDGPGALAEPSTAPSVVQPERAPVRRPAAQTLPEESATVRLVRAPTAGVFYRAPGPGQLPFVEVGKSVSAEDTLCLVEVMKLFQSVSAGVPGRVAAILADNGETVEQGQALLVIEVAE